MFLIKINRIFLLFVISLFLGLSTTGCSYFSKEVKLFDETLVKGEEGHHYDAADNQDADADNKDNSVANSENTEDVKTVTEDNGGVIVSAGPVVKGLVADIRKRAYEEKKTLKKPVVIASIEDEPEEENKVSENAASDNNAVTAASTASSDEPPAPKANPVIAVNEQDIKDKTENTVVSALSEDSKPSEQENLFVKDASSADESSLIASNVNTNDFEYESVIRTSEKNYDNDFGYVSRNDDLSVSDDFPGLLPLPEDDFDIEISKYDDLADSSSDDFDFSRSSSNLGSFDTVIVDDEMGTMPLSKYNGNGAISYLAAVVYHEHGKSDIDTSNLSEVRKVAKNYKNQRAFIKVVGHASSRTANLDPVDHMMANFTMSLQRARSVAKYLIECGVKPSDIYVGAVSDSEPIYYEVMPFGEAKNRRTEIYIEYP
ncbi:MAG: OmpA family protein [Alphaproteobacteria bacterium]